LKFFPISRDPGHFQKTLSASQIEAMCNRTYGDSPVVSAQELDSGLFNNTFLIVLEKGDQAILRIAPDRTSRVFFNEVDLLRREYMLHPYFGAVSHLIPKIVFADFSHQLIDRDYLFQSYLAGELWDAINDDLSDVEISGLWKQLGCIAKEIHATRGTDGFGYPNPAKRHNRWSDAIMSIVAGMHRDLIDLQIDDYGVNNFIDLLEKGRNYLDQIKIPYLLHGDLWPKNILVDRTDISPRIVGLLDSERGLWGDPMAEWIFHYWEVPRSFWEAYGEIKSGEGARFRKSAYFGMYTVQLFLEAWRFGWDDDKFRSNLFEATSEMMKYV
jgi:aminoglycoside phosphotransferase (APT) family kinase protein